MDALQRRRYDITRARRAQTRASLPRRTPGPVAILFIGDIHGCADEFEELLGRAGANQGCDRILLTGDAFSRGPDPARVWEVIRSADAQMVLGNHDARLLEYLRLSAAGHKITFRRPHHRATYDQLAPLAHELLPWLESCPLYMQSPPSGEFARQGGLPPKDKAPAGGFVLVHAGINPEKGLAGTTRSEFLTIRTWPPTDDLQGPRWHESVGLDSGLIVFGHDAPGGIVIRRLHGAADRRPRLVGLDSGCVYGGCLSGYLLEEDRLVQVDSRQPPR